MTDHGERARPMCTQNGPCFELAELRVGDGNGGLWGAVEDGRECLAFEGALSPGRDITDMGSLDD